MSLLTLHALRIGHFWASTSSRLTQFAGRLSFGWRGVPLFQECFQPQFYRDPGVKLQLPPIPQHSESHCPSTFAWVTTVTSWSVITVHSRNYGHLSPHTAAWHAKCTEIVRFGKTGNVQNPQVNRLQLPLEPLRVWRMATFYWPLFKIFLVYFTFIFYFSLLQCLENEKLA